MMGSLLNSYHYSVEVFPHYLKFRTLKENLIRPFVALHLENESYVVKTADTFKELSQVFELRFDVFHKEFSSRKIHFPLFPYDIDRFDFKCDHLIVVDKKTQSVVATYRVRSSLSSSEISYYTETEFHLDDFLTLPGNKLELGRACVHKDFRNGSVISLLWKGLLAYAKKTHTKYLFGCSSVVMADIHKLPQITKELEARKALVKDYMVHARTEYRKGKYNLAFQKREAESDPGTAMNSLMSMYILAGAKMSSDYAYDADMGCVDIFTVVDLEKMPASFARKFS